MEEQLPPIRPPLREYTEDEQNRLLLMTKDCLKNSLRPLLDPHHHNELCTEVAQHLHLLLQSDLCQEWSLNFVKLGCKLMIRRQFRANLEQGVAHGTNGKIFDYESLPAGWKCHRDIANEANAFGFNDGRFANKDSTSTFHSAFWELPLDLAQKLIPDFLRSRELAAVAWSRFPHLYSDRAFWEGLIADPANWAMIGCMVGYADFSIRRDRDLMLQACIHDVWAVQFDVSGIDPALFLDNSFFEAVVNQRPEAAHMFPIEVQRANRDWILAVLPRFETDYIIEEPEVPPEFFYNEAYLLHWILNGGIFTSFPARLRRMLESDENTFRLFASNDYRSFEYASRNLRSNKVFMLEMVEIEPEVHKYVAENLLGDMDILIAAARDLDPSNENDMRMFGDVYAHVQAGLTNRAAFEAFCYGTHVRSGSPISFIGLGKETFEYFMNFFAELVGVPEGDNLRRIRNAFQGGTRHDDDE